MKGPAKYLTLVLTIFLLVVSGLVLALQVSTSRQLYNLQQRLGQLEVDLKEAQKPKRELICY